MRNEQTKAAENNSYGKNWRESTDVRLVIMKSKQQVNWKTWSRGTNSHLLFAVNAMLDLSSS